MIEYHGHHILTLLLHLMWNLFDMAMGTGDLHNIQIYDENQVNVH